jgi:threonyl-tRNA synthetase
LLVVGDKEMENSEIAVRTRGGEDLGKMSVDDFIAKLTQEVETRT